MERLTPAGYGLRLLFALVLVMATYNPSEYSYYHWLKDTLPQFNPLLAICGILLVIGWVIYIRATLRSLGPIGLTLASLFLAAIIWWLIDLGWLKLETLTAVSWVIIVILAVILSVGMSWSHIRRRLAGQVDADDVEDND